jgi:hypothetical protein
MTVCRDDRSLSIATSGLTLKAFGGPSTAASLYQIGDFTSLRSARSIAFATPVGAPDLVFVPVEARDRKMVSSASPSADVKMWASTILPPPPRRRGDDGEKPRVIRREHR